MYRSAFSADLLTRVKKLVQSYDITENDRVSIEIGHKFMIINHL